MKISSMYHRLLIFDVNSTTKIDGMGPFKVQLHCHHPENFILKVKVTLIVDNVGVISRFTPKTNA